MFATFRTPDGQPFGIRITSITGYSDTRNRATRNVNFLIGDSSLTASVIDSFEEIEAALQLPGIVKLRVQMRDDDGQPLLAWADQAIDVDTVVGYHQGPDDHCVLLVQQGKAAIQLLAKTTIGELAKALEDASNEA